MTKQRRMRRTLWLLFATLGVLVLFFLPRIWGDLVYPLRYQDHILKYSKEFNVPPTLIAGVIYTESHYNPVATSRVGARGLMQIMPATGAGLARQLGDGSYSVEKLYDPETNIRYGTYYLRSLLDTYGNDVDVVLVAYNGGSSAANRYQASRSANIPLETSGFIVKVKRARDNYAQIYGTDLSAGSATTLADLSGKVKKEETKTFWDQMFGWLFTK